MLSFLIPLAFPDRQLLNVFKEKLECGGSREGGERIRERVVNFFHCVCGKARVLAGMLYCGSQELQKGACRGDEKMREKRARYVWRLDTRVLYFLSVCERVFIMSVHKRYMPTIVLPTPLPKSLLSRRFVGVIIVSALKKQTNKQKSIQYFLFHLSDYIISVLINMLQLWLLINMLFIEVSVLN